ncbi:MAG: tetracycline resistance MFS efflux pump [Saprospiraceae bacterium]|nr:MAG: tetracycline resistance MFS efflux pump [Saprospiraceae bacterium]
MTKDRSTSPLLTIFLTVFIDMLGIGIIIPVIPALFFEDSSGFFNPTVSMDHRSILYGLLVACYPFMQLFGAPMLGALSDRYGRKPLLSISLVGTMVGYLLFAYAILTNNLILLFFSRMLPGFTGGNISIILSAIADISDAKSKAKNFGLVGAAFGIGFILGPALGGILADNTIVSWFNHATPFWLTAGLTLVNLIIVQFRFPETLKEKSETPVSLFRGLSNVGKSFQQPALRTIFAVILLLSLGFSFFTQFFSVYLIQEFDYTVKNIGLLYCWIGIWLAFTQGFIVRRMSGRVPSGLILNYSILMLSLSLGVILLPDQSFWFYIINPFIAIAQGITSPNLTTVVSEQALATQQGEILGINQSMQSLGQLFPPLIAGYLNTLNSNFPLLAAAAFTLAGWLVYVFIFRASKRE